MISQLSLMDRFVVMYLFYVLCCRGIVQIQVERYIMLWLFLLVLGAGLTFFFK